MYGSKKGIGKRFGCSLKGCCKTAQGKPPQLEERRTRGPGFGIAPPSCPERVRHAMTRLLSCPFRAWVFHPTVTQGCIVVPRWGTQGRPKLRAIPMVPYEQVKCAPSRFPMPENRCAREKMATPFLKVLKGAIRRCSPAEGSRGGGRGDGW